MQTCHCGCASSCPLVPSAFCRLQVLSLCLFIDGIVQLGGFCAVGKCTGTHVARQLGCDCHSAFSAGFQIRCLIIGDDVAISINADMATVENNTFFIE